MMFEHREQITLNPGQDQFAAQLILENVDIKKF